MTKYSVEQLHRLLIEKKLTLSLAESATGGALAARITSQAECSAYFLGSIVAYANQVKVKCLGVSEITLATYGAVSGEVVAEMAKGVQKATGSDYAIAVSGIAGPTGGSPKKPVGTHWAAIVFRNEEPLVWSFHVDGDRHEVIHKTVDLLIEKLISYISRR